MNPGHRRWIPDGNTGWGNGLEDMFGPPDAFFPDIAEEEEEEEEDEDEDEEEYPPPPPPPPPPGKGGKNQQNRGGKGQQNQNQNQKQGNQKGGNQRGGQQQQQHQHPQHQQQQQHQHPHQQQHQHLQHQHQQQQQHPHIQHPHQQNKQHRQHQQPQHHQHQQPSVINGQWGQKGKGEENSNPKQKQNKNGKKQPRMQEVEDEDTWGAGPGQGPVGGEQWGTASVIDWGMPAEAASAIGFGPGGGSIGPGSMAGWGRQTTTATNPEWGAPPPQSFRRQQDQLASLLNHPRVWTPGAGVAKDVRSQSHPSISQSSARSQQHPPPAKPSEGSRTFWHATTAPTASVLEGGAKNGPHTQVQILDSGGAALEAADRALFGHERLANQRIHWMFSPDKDSRVSSLMEWIQSMNHALATLGVHHLLQTQQRGALFANADFRHWQFTSEPTFDWMTFDDIVDTYDKTLQESIAFYDVENQVLVFVFLLSPRKNSMAIWRRKIAIPNAVRTQNRTELTKVAKSLSKRKFVLTVDNLPPQKVAVPLEPPKPKKKWFNILR